MEFFQGILYVMAIAVFAASATTAKKVSYSEALRRLSVGFALFAAAGLMPVIF